MENSLENFVAFKPQGGMLLFSSTLLVFKVFEGLNIKKVCLVLRCGDQSSV